MFLFWLLQFRRISSRALHRIMIFSHLNPGNENPSFYFTGKYFKTWIVLKIIRGSADKIFSIDTCKWVWQRQILPYCRWRNSRDQKVRNKNIKEERRKDNEPMALFPSKRWQMFNTVFTNSAPCPPRALDSGDWVQQVKSGPLWPSHGPASRVLGPNTAAGLHHPQTRPQDSGGQEIGHQDRAILLCSPRLRLGRKEGVLHFYYQL